MGDFYISKSSNSNSNNQDVYILGVKLPSSPAISLLIIAGGIMLCYCASSISQEYVYSTGFTYSTFLTLVAKVTAALWGVGVVYITHNGSLSSYQRKCPHSKHCMIGLLSFGTMWLSNESLRYLNYATQSVFKSAKLIPVMIASMIILKRRYHVIEYISAVSLFVGLTCFTFGDINESPSFSFLGVAYITAALACDAVIGNVQESMFKGYGADSNEMLIYSNVYAAVLSFIFSIYELPAAIHFTAGNIYALNAILMYSILNIVGIYFVLAGIERFGAVTTTFVTSLRKAVTVILSFLLFTKPWDHMYAYGGILTAVGIILNMRASQLKKSQPKHQEKDASLTSSNELASTSSNHSNGHANGNHVNGMDDTNGIQLTSIKTVQPAMNGNANGHGSHHDHDMNGKSYMHNSMSKDDMSHDTYETNDDVHERLLNEESHHRRTLSHKAPHNDLIQKANTVSDDKHVHHEKRDLMHAAKEANDKEKEIHSANSNPNLNIEHHSLSINRKRSISFGSDPIRSEHGSPSQQLRPSNLRN